VQVIQEVAKTVGHLTIFQRSPNWCAPLNNGPITEEQQAEIKITQAEIFRRCNDSYGGFIHDSIREKTVDVSDAQRHEFWEKRYREPGFGIWFGNYRDVLVSPEANGKLTEFIAGKIRDRVDDPTVAEMLIPTDHGFGTRRVPMETGYYEVYNQANVELVDVRTGPITRITPTGIETDAGHWDLDLIIFATGFDAVTGAFDRVDFRGSGGRTLKETWGDGPQTVLGVSTPGFPNMFTLVGPHNAATFCNMPRCIEQNVDWVTDLLVRSRERGERRVEATRPAAEAWTLHVHETVERLLLSKVDSWFNGVNHNLTDHPPRVLLYGGGLPLYRERCDAEAGADYPSFTKI
jgi:cation diffusion facilitator CzcD-associated flavoprotein CzcO